MENEEVGPIIVEIQLLSFKKIGNLVSYNITTKWSKNARRDVFGCIDPKYKENDLYEDRYPPSTHFRAKKHYDTGIYLNELYLESIFWMTHCREI